MSSRSGRCALLLLVISAASAETNPEPDISVTRLPVQTEVPLVPSVAPLPQQAQNALPGAGKAPQKAAKARRKPRKGRIEPPGLLSKRPRR